MSLDSLSRQSKSVSSHSRGVDVQALRAVAAFEALKGALVLLLGFGLLAFHQRLNSFAELLISRIHLNPERPAARALLHAAGNLTDAHLWLIALGVLTYAGVRFAEAWGLWSNQSWAQYFGILSGALYLPWEAWEAVRKPTTTHETLLVLNILVVVFLVFVRVSQSRRENRAA